MTNRVAIITGGAKGIGRAIGVRLAKDGWSVALCYRTSADAAQEAVSLMEQHGGRALATCCDVSDPAACEAFVGQVTREWQRVDALLNCAGPYRRVPLLQETTAGWREMFDLNLHPVFYMSRLVAPSMIEQRWGRIVNFSMANADQGVAQPQITAHYVAKAGVLILTRTLARLLASHGITVNAISPGFISSGSAPAEELEKMLKHIPAGRIGDLGDAVSAATFLLSDDAGYINGTNLHLSGAWGV
jgi:3-oxoacyl-[acyl-carrier protein] reductase